MRPKVLILSSIYDFSTDLVVLRLRDLGVPFLRLNREQMKDCRLSLDPIERTLRIKELGVELQIGPDLISAWFRQPVFLRNTPAQPLTIEEQLESSQWAAFMRALSVFDDAAWMNFPQATYLAECKPYQLLMANRCGLKIPRTIVGNNVTIIKDTLPPRLMIKSLDTVLLKEEGDCLFTYTTAATQDDLTDAVVYRAPLLAQEMLSQKTDIRVTVVGEKIFAVRIMAEDHGIEGDWRMLPRERLQYQDTTLRQDISDSLLMLVRSLELSFAAIDLVETPEETYFIEVNPTGEWGWLSSPERPIDFAIANWLKSPSSVRGA
jgi:hypothetical protein